jgi:hypothetical protein
MRAKITAMALFLTLLDRFKNHIFYERKRMKKLAPFIRALIKGTRSFVARALKNALMLEHRLPALGS